MIPTDNKEVFGKTWEEKKIVQRMEKTMHRNSVVTPKICLPLLDVNLEKALAKCVNECLVN